MQIRSTYRCLLLYSYVGINLIFFYDVLVSYRSYQNVNEEALIAQEAVKFLMKVVVFVIFVFNFIYLHLHEFHMFQ